MTITKLLRRLHRDQRGAVSLETVLFDLTRQKESIAYRLDGTTWTEVVSAGLVPSSWPSGDEVPNDDNANDHEDPTPLNDRVYAVDTPGHRSDTAFADRFVMRFNFREFVRVHVNFKPFTDDVDPAKDTNKNGFVHGSRCSARFDWRSRMDVTKNLTTGKWQRNVAGENEIVTGHKGLTVNKPWP